MPRRTYHAHRHYPRPYITGPTTETLLAQAEALTRLARTTWITVILGCLYVWIAIAALRDIQLFLPSETLTLPILNIGISPEGFFVFAPALLLAVYIYLHLILLRLWRVYRDLMRFEPIDGLSAADRVPPWMLSHVLQQKGRSFDWLGHFVAVFFGWVFAPLTVFALCYRYLRAHDGDMTAYHSAVVAIAIVAAIAFWLAKYRILHGNGPRQSIALAAAGVVGLWPLFLIGAHLLVKHGDIHRDAPDFLTARAQLLRAELSLKPANWDGLAITRLDRRIELLEVCQADSNTAECNALAIRGKQGAKALAEARQKRADLLTNVDPAALGHEAASDGFGPSDFEVFLFGKNYCDDNKLVSAAADLRGADLRRAFLASANLRCANLAGADLRDSELFNADLRSARMEETNLVWARMEGANLSGVRMERANLFGARMEGANLFGAQSEGASLSGARMEGANLRGAWMEGVNLRAARIEEGLLMGSLFQDKWLTSADLELASFRGSALRFVDLSVAENIRDNLHFNDAFGDRSVTLPDGWSYPAHWAETIIFDDAVFYGRWRHWREDRGMPWPPPGKALEHLARYEAIAPD